MLCVCFLVSKCVQVIGVSAFLPDTCRTRAMCLLVRALIGSVVCEDSLVFNTEYHVCVANAHECCSSRIGRVYGLACLDSVMCLVVFACANTCESVRAPLANALRIRCSTLSECYRGVRKQLSACSKW